MRNPLPWASNTDPLPGAARARPAIHTSNRLYGVQRSATVQPPQRRRRSPRPERPMGKRLSDNTLRALGYPNAGWLVFGSSCPASTGSRPDERAATIEVLSAPVVVSLSWDAKFFDRKSNVARPDSRAIEAILSLRFNKPEMCDSFATQKSMALLQRTGDLSR